MRVKIIKGICLTLAAVCACTGETGSHIVIASPTQPSTTMTSTDDNHQPHAGMLRYPDVSATHIVFVYANDLWIVPRTGGTAMPLASPPGGETFPRFSADGNTIAYVGNYEGNRDLYTVNTSGSISTRVTHHGAGETMCDWTPDGQLLYYSNALTGLRRQTQLFSVSPTGGMSTKLPVPYGANGTISADNQWLAYTPHTRDARTWKRYRGGMATDIWLLNLQTHESKQITDWEGTDTLPMWLGNTVYYLSDQGKSARLNIWAYDVSSGKRTQITDINEYDVKWPAMGPGVSGGGEIVYQRGPDMVLLDLSTGKQRIVNVTIPGDRPTIRSRQVDYDDYITSGDISPTGKRAVFEARGNIWTVPAKHGTPRHLTRTDDAAERSPSWSPDGQWIAYFSDKTGEYELYLIQSDGQGVTRKLTSNANTFRYAPTWSPDSKLIAFSDKTGDMYMHQIESGETKKFDTDQWSGPTQFSWSKDSQWITYAKGGDNRQGAIWLYHVEDDKSHQVTSGMFNDTWPTFDRKGDYLFFASNRHISSPIYEDLGQSFTYSNTDMLFVVPLRDEVSSPWAPKSDDEAWGDKANDEDKKDGDDDAKKDTDDQKKSTDAKDEDDGDDDDDSEKDKDEEGEEPIVIKLENFERRAIPLPVDHGAFSNLAVNDKGQLVYVRGARAGSDGKPAIKIYDLDDEDKKEDEKEKTVVKGSRNFAMSANGKKLLVRKDKTYAIVDAKADQKLDEPLSLSGMKAQVQPRAEWRQLLLDAWRIERDFFYDPNMHGVDWKAIRDQYLLMLKDCVSREDVTFVIGEMISEINVGHAYVRGGPDLEEQPRVSVGYLGADYTLENGAFRIGKIYEGAAWDTDARGPLSQPGVDVKTGDYLLAINGVKLDTSKDPWAAFQGLAKKTVTITVSDKPTKDDDARDVVIELLDSESTLRYRSWIEHNRAYVEKMTDGRVGYIYVPDTGVNGQNNLFRQFFGQIHKDAMIIDERWNGGGQIPTRFIELLNRPITNYWARRNGTDWAWPPDAHQGPKCMLINGLAGSGGDAFPFYFRQANLGKLIGMRTWGGLVGMSGNPGLIDGGSVTAPSFSFYETDGTWGIEGHGVDPDIKVIDDPALMVDGGDPQLDAAIDLMLNEIKRNPYVKPDRPDYPNRSGMGITVEDR